VNKNAQLQTADQTLKGAVIALVVYVATKYDWDMELVALVIPVVSGVMAALSSLIGNKDTACVFVARDDSKQT
jgi:hypothetical protein